MEVPRYWRTMPTNMSFTGSETDAVGTEHAIFKFPGGEVPLNGTYDEIYDRFERRGFNPEVTEKILFNLFGAIASKSAISFEKIVNSKSELVGSEVRKQDRGEVKLGIDRLPRKISGKTLFSASANN